jgi:phage recombination protein Bet
MTQALTQQPQKALTWTEEQRELIRNTMAPGLTSEEFAVYMEAAERMQLDPLTKQIYVFSQYVGKDKRKRLYIAPTIDGYWAIAQRNGPLLPVSEDFPVIDDELVCTVRGRVRMCGEWVEVSQRAYYDEQNRGGPLWKGKPRIMLGKCAWARLIRKLFPEDLSGTTIPEEVGDETVHLEPAHIEEPWNGVSAVRDLASELAPDVQRYADATGVAPKKAWEDTFRLVTGRERAADCTQEDVEKLRDAWREALEEIGGEHQELQGLEV